MGIDLFHEGGKFTDTGIFSGHIKSLTRNSAPVKDKSGAGQAQGIEAEQKIVRFFVGAESPVPAAGGNAPK
jgi:hypothetical protein